MVFFSIKKRRFPGNGVAINGWIVFFWHFITEHLMNMDDLGVFPHFRNLHIISHWTHRETGSVPCWGWKPQHDSQPESIINAKPVWLTMDPIRNRYTLASRNHTTHGQARVLIPCCLDYCHNMKVICCQTLKPQRNQQFPTHLYTPFSTISHTCGIEYPWIPYNVAPPSYKLLKKTWIL